MSKEFWFAEYERLLNEAEMNGLMGEAASDWAAERAMNRLKERLADLIDIERKRRKER